VSSTCFISDLHLDPTRPAITRALAAFLTSHTHCAQLYILGDLFEAWPGDDDDSPVAKTVVRLLRAFSDAGPELFIMQGNRDFLLGEEFCESAGASLLTDPTVIDLYGEPTLLMHGDSLCTADTEYQQFRLMARGPDWQASLLAKPLEERRALAVHLREMSSEATSMKSEDIMDVTPVEVEREMKAHRVRQLIHGHTHRPARHDSSSGLRWVLGAWEGDAWFLEASTDGVKLININLIQ
jgi:UDP-2,3-diacylglucosamine hydrolase